jgi:heme-degrading monooxygenase HmoA
MLVKWITCEVPPAAEVEFSAAQAGWSALSAVPGLIGQVGGWNKTGTACVLAVWEDRGTYETFLRDHHDRIVATTGQAGTYDTIDIAVGTVLQDMPGTAAGRLYDAEVLRVADCRVRPGRDDHFRDVQRTVWAPGMAEADGMLGGLFTQLDDHRYLVTTGWRDAESHRRYVAERFPRLRELAGAAGDLSAIRGHEVALTRSWRVTGEAPSRLE